MKRILYILILTSIFSIYGCNNEKDVNKQDIQLNQTNKETSEHDSLDNYICGNTNISPYYKPEIKPNDEKVEYIPINYEVDTFEYLDLDEASSMINVVISLLKKYNI